MAIEDKTKERIYQIAIAISMALASATFGWAWNLNAEIAVMKSLMLQDDASRATADEVLQDWSKMESNVASLQRQMQKMWGNYNKALDEKELARERVAKIEAKLEFCCD